MRFAGLKNRFPRGRRRRLWLRQLEIIYKLTVSLTALIPGPSVSLSALQSGKMGLSPGTFHPTDCHVTVELEIRNLDCPDESRYSQPWRCFAFFWSFVSFSATLGASNAPLSVPSAKWNTKSPFFSLSLDGFWVVRSRCARILFATGLWFCCGLKLCTFARPGTVARMRFPFFFPFFFAVRSVLTARPSVPRSERRNNASEIVASPLFSFSQLTARDLECGCKGVFVVVVVVVGGEVASRWPSAITLTENHHARSPLYSGVLVCACVLLGAVFRLT